MDDKSRASGLRLGENTPACPTQEQVTLTDAGTRLQTSSLCCLCSSSLLLLFVSVQDGCALVCVWSGFTSCGRVFDSLLHFVLRSVCFASPFRSCGVSLVDFVTVNFKQRLREWCHQRVCVTVSVLDTEWLYVDERVELSRRGFFDLWWIFLH